MEWYQSIIGNASPVFNCMETKDCSDNSEHILWCVDKHKSHTQRITISDQGNILASEKVFDYPYHTLRHHNEGYVCASTHMESLLLVGYDKSHKKRWSYTFDNEKICKWDMALCHTGAVYVFYMSKKSGSNAHVLCIDEKGTNKFHHIFSIPEFDIVNTSIILTCTNHLSFCVKTHRKKVISYCIDRNGNLLSKKYFSSHEQSKDATPTCGKKIGNGHYLLGGYREGASGKQKTPWICLFDYDMTPLHEVRLPSIKMSQSVKEFAMEEDGSILALASPWTIYRFNQNGFVTHVFEMPSHMHSITLTSIKPSNDHSCLVTGNMYINIDDKLTPSVWCGKLSNKAFIPVKKA